MPKIKRAPKEEVKDVEATEGAGTNGEAGVGGDGNGTSEGGQPASPKKGKGRKSAAPDTAAASDERPVLYPDVTPVVYARGYQEPTVIGAHEGEMTAVRMKELLGWTEVPSSEQDYDIKDAFGTKVRLLNNYGNRDFSKTLAADWKLEVLKRHWYLNGESIVIGRHGMVISGQHRGVGLVLAAQEWSKPASASSPMTRVWHDLWGSPSKGGTEPTMPVVVVYGISEDDKTVNTLDTGRPRSESDALYRSELFKGYTYQARKEVSRAMSYAVRTVWERTGQADQGFTPRRTHSDMFDFIDSHKRLRDCVEFVFKRNHGRDNKKNVPWHLISTHIGVGVAAGLMYLMAASKSDFDKYHRQRRARNAHQRYLDMSMYDTAAAFWAEFAEASGQMKTDANRVSPLLVLITHLEAERVDGRAADLDKRIALIVKAWHSYVRHEGEVRADELQLVYKVHGGTGVRYFDDYPEIGGVDVPNTSKVEGLRKRLDARAASPESRPTPEDIDGSEGYAPGEAEDREDTAAGDDDD
jgi:hypothetical protein